ncbi:general transcription and DNA repair factor IIH subunit TFB4-like isoform X2 [Cornus florida]|uniref:general transcription and DNA repair factor IIH subunit TFB4-like isoform X2 n=1 Tax=Cornus florida TaxID=4283 RepID=UPI00289C7770|nr:general transcription and DNA repair factor IIH subunit TFB4-like isoform X2 [Cornus florida]
MTPVLSKEYVDDVNPLTVLMDTNPFFRNATTNTLSFSKFLSRNSSVLSVLNSILLLNQVNQVVVIATGFNSCEYVYDLSSNEVAHNQRAESLLRRLEEFVIEDEKLTQLISWIHLFSSPLITLSM